MDVTAPPSTWHEALEAQPVSKVRALEKELRASALRDKEKLRSLVGSNYRDLLLTAEQIVLLNDEARAAESGISSLSQACHPPEEGTGRRALDDKVKVAGQLRFVDSLCRYSSKSIKGGSVGQASKALLIARLLLKHLEESLGTSSILCWLNKRLKTLRQQLLRCTDVLFVRPTTPVTKLAEAAAAYCLTTSSSSTDVINYFQDLRAHRLSILEIDGLETRAKIRYLTQQCHYLVASVAAIKVLAGRRVNDLLTSLQKKPILQDADLEKAEGLQLDLVRNLLPSDIVLFTPYFKRGNVTATQLTTSVQNWVEERIRVHTKHITAVLDNCKLAGVLRARSEVLNSLLPSCFSAHLHNAALQEIRQSFSHRIITLLEQQAQDLRKIGDRMKLAEQGSFSHMFWASDVVKKSTARSTNTHLHALQAAHLGISKAAQASLHELRTWLKLTQRTKSEFEKLLKIRWQDKIEEYDDEEEDTAQEIIEGLSKADPEKYLNTYDTYVQTAAEDFVTRIAQLTTEISAKRDHTSNINQVTTLLRTIREVRQVLKVLIPTQRFEGLAQCVDQLEENLAHQTAAELFEIVEKDNTSAGSIFIAEDLPSPVTISVMKQLCETMARQAGIDLWTPSAISKLKSGVLERALSANKREFYVRSELDEHYLQTAFGNGQTRSNETANATARKAALYWNRTRKLFGMLDAQG